ncbi:MAG: DivIVA domain-containing protein [Oscillospiraceae bacterium]
MLTPKEVAEHSFGKSSFSGYNMAAVDDFLDSVTTDYETLYKDNTILKQKLGILSEKINEYRATEDAMRQTLLTAQRMANDMVVEAEGKRDALVRQAEQESRERILQLQDQVAAEELRVTAAKNATAAYVAQLQRLCKDQQDYLSRLDSLVPPPPSRAQSVADDIEAAVRRATEQEQQQETPPVSDDSLSDTRAFDVPLDDDTAASIYETLTAARQDPPEQKPADPDATRRIDLINLEFGKNYETK